jgi:hypothetical protein
MIDSLHLELAPIVLFTYNRPRHTEQTLNALMQNKLASESTLYIYCDGPRKNANEADLEKIQNVRKIIKKENWCKTVNIIESVKNQGLATSIRTGVTDIVKKHGKVIVMEDDLLTSSAFLTYMNKALNYYETRKSVFSISAYCLPPNKFQIPDDYNYDVFVGLRNSSWGWATWSDRWQQVDWDVAVFNEIKSNPEIKEAFNRRGDDVFEMLEMQQSGKLDIWSIQFTVAHFKNHAVSIIPTISYVDNIGFDGTGENCGVTEALKNTYLSENENIRFIDILYQDKRITNAFYSAYYRKKRPVLKKIANRLSRAFLKKNIFTIKRKIYC